MLRQTQVPRAGEKVCFGGVRLLKVCESRDLVRQSGHVIRRGKRLLKKFSQCGGGDLSARRRLQRGLPKEVKSASHAQREQPRQKNRRRPERSRCPRLVRIG